MGPNIWDYVFELFRNPVFDVGLVFWFIHRCFKVYPELNQKFFGSNPEAVSKKRTGKRSKQARARK